MHADARRFWGGLLVLVALCALAGCWELDGYSDRYPRAGGVEEPDVLRAGPLSMDRDAVQAWREGSEVRVRLPVENGSTSAFRGRLVLTVIDAAGGIREVASESVRLAGGMNEVEAGFALPEGFPAGSEGIGVLGGKLLGVSLSADDLALAGRLSFYRIWRKAELTLFSVGDVPLGGRTGLRLLVRDPRSGAPLVDVPVRAWLERDDVVVELPAGRSDSFGLWDATVEAEVELEGEWTLVAETEVEGELWAVRSPLEITREQRVLLTTDKPVYQPGQRIHMRALALSRPTLRPAAGRPLIFEAEDAKGNRVFRQETVTSEFGAGWVELPLARELNQGTWTLRAIVDGVASERAVTVEPYVLPRFRVDVRPDRGHYRPGDTAIVDVDARYFFGEAVEGGVLEVQPWTFDVGFQPLPPVTGTLDGSGMGRVEIPIPRFLVGQDLNQGNAFVRLDVSVTDRTEQRETVTRNLVVADQDLAQEVIPATAIVPGAQNLFYLLTRTPAGRPVATESTVRLGEDEFEVETDALGFAEFLVEVPAVEALSLRVTSRAEGESAERTFSFAPGEGGPVMALLSDRALYRVGERVEMDVRTTARTRRAFVDVMREGQVLQQESIDITDGAGAFGFDLSEDFAGPLRVDVYTVTEDAQIVRGQRLLHVEGASDLEVSWETDAEEYRPGGTAEVSLRVRDGEGRPVVAALGIQIVDEAVFALQDMRPGLERVYFELEEELLEPQYTLYGWSFEQVMASGELDEQTRQTMAAVVMAATHAPLAGRSSQPLLEEDAAALVASRPLLDAAVEQVVGVASARYDRQLGGGAGAIPVELEEMWYGTDALQEWLDELPPVVDAWGRRVRLEAVRMEWQSGVAVRSSGLDRKPGTRWDVERRLPLQEILRDVRGRGGDNRAGDGAMPPGAPGEWASTAESAGGWTDMDDAMPASGSGGGEQPRVRSFFPETLYVAPDLITDEEGRVVLSVPLADNITTWRMTALASSGQGELGSSTAGLRVFQPFFVDIQFPLSLTMNDEVRVPVAIFNYLEEGQDVRLRVDAPSGDPWYTLLDDAEKEVRLEAGEVTVRYFRVRVDRPGRHAFQITALGSEMSDAVRRVVDVVPDGRRVEESISDRLSGSLTRSLTIPAEAIEEANELFVKIYPGLFAQVVEGLESLLRVPSGCFEQTSSTSYPNLLVLRYLKESGTVTPELELRARELLAQGYQRLVSYEVDGGGFEWFGNAPAHRILSAYGLLQFHDMQAVFDVDPAVIARTQAWLASQQESDGRWRAAPEGIHEGATNSFQDSDLRATAYLTYAMAESGEQQASGRGLGWLRSRTADVEDPYTLAMIANAFLAAGESGSVVRGILDRLDGMKEEQSHDTGTLYFWESGSESLYYSRGSGMAIETTALAIQAYLRAGYSPTTVSGGIGWLLTQKDSFGNFSTTQGTILTLRVFIEQLLSSTSEAAGTIAISMNGELQEEFEVTQANADLLRQLDLSELASNGTHEIALEFEGEGELLFQILGRWWMPHEEEGEEEGLLSIDIEWDRTRLEVDEEVEATVTVRNRSDARVDMVMIDLGIPPGFRPRMSDFQPYIDDPTVPISRVERAGRQLTVYVYGLDAGQTLTFSYRMVAELAVRAAAPPSAVWLYYTPAERSEAAPADFEVN